MENSFYAYLMQFNGSGAPVLTKKSVQLHPGSITFQQEGATKIYLAGGFNAIFPEADTPLSPALQINGDLGSLSPDSLQRIGRAELDRINSTTFRSYIKETDRGVALMGRDPHALSRFLETYGGVLLLEPLLVGAYHPDFVTAEEPAMEPRPDGCRLRYTVRKAVDRDKCTYCAACGPACPENCLDEQLFLDMSKCSYCNECVRNCPVNAIDLYRVEEFDTLFPAIVLLDDPPLTLPEDTIHIHRSNRLDRLFASLVPVNIEETISWDASCCQLSTRENSGCAICLDACSHAALKQEQDTIVVDYERCVECGACQAACPTGALQFSRFTDSQFIDWLSTVRPEKNSTIVVGSERELHRLWWKKEVSWQGPVLFLEHPCVRSLSAMHLLLLLGMGGGQVILLDEPALLQNKPISVQVRLADTIFSSLFGGGERISIVPTSSLAESMWETALTPLEEVFHDGSFRNRREKLGALLSFFLSQSSAQERMLTDETAPAFGFLDCDIDRCTHCGACLNDCRIEALTTDNETLSLNHQAILCVQCGNCVQTCPEKALTLRTGLRLAPSFLAPKELTSAEPVTCPACGKPFGTRKSYERIMAVLKEHNPDMADRDVLAYCETCRVVKLFEAQQS